MSITGTINSNVTYNNINTSGSSSEGILVSSSAGFYVAHNTLITSGSNSDGVSIAQSNDSTIENNTINVSHNWGAAGISMSLISNNNLLLNNFVTAENYSTETFVDAGYNNTIIYNNSYGQINWTGNNLTSAMALEINETVFLQPNLLGLLDDSGALKLNNSARITFWGLDLSIEPDLLKNGLEYCFSPDCEIIDWGSDYAVFDVNSFSN
ncbi:hypothetical protein HN587_02385, partial [Candidatus Woesearchaeota archaeon]|nr:hypothetical protein [Candidatus Woesearchaeota archaeon]